MKTESQEQIDLIQWTKRNIVNCPKLALVFSIPNGGKRHIATASRLKLEGVKPGVPDLMWPVARGMYHGLYIELKRIKGGSVSVHQRKWIKELREENYYVVVAKGAEDAKKVIKKYWSLGTFTK